MKCISNSKRSLRVRINDASMKVKLMVLTISIKINLIVKGLLYAWGLWLPLIPICQVYYRETISNQYSNNSRHHAYTTRKYVY